MTDLTYLLKISIFWTKKKKKFFKNSLEEIFFFCFWNQGKKKSPAFDDDGAKRWKGRKKILAVRIFARETWRWLMSRALVNSRTTLQISLVIGGRSPTAVESGVVYHHMNKQEGKWHGYRFDRKKKRGREKRWIKKIRQGEGWKKKYELSYQLKTWIDFLRIFNKLIVLHFDKLIKHFRNNLPR